VGSSAIRLGARVTEVEEAAGGVLVHVEKVTADGSCRPAPALEADLVVAADGTHSSLRAHVLGAATARRYVGYVNWNGLVHERADVTPASTWLTWVGEGKRVSVMPVGGGRYYTWFDMPMSWADATEEQNSLEALAGHFAGWPSEVSALIGMLDPAGVARIPIHDTGRLERWARGRVVLLGDAAHTMSPDLGQGGCQAIEDAWVLAHYLTATGRSIEDALARYERERLPHTANMVNRARRRADAIHGVDPAATAEWYRSLETDGPSAIIDGLAQSVETGPCR